jgi:hypothetical protein
MEMENRGVTVKYYGGGFGSEYLVKAGDVILKHCGSLAEAEALKAAIDACYTAKVQGEAA